MLIEARNIEKRFGPEPEDSVLNGVDLAVDCGEFVAITGRSGSGKSTLLNILSGIMRPDGGSLHFEGRDITELGSRELDCLRATGFAMIFQAHHLLPYLTAEENVLLPAMRGLRPVSREQTEAARECLARVGLDGKGHRLPGELSGGECQRVAIARGLAKKAAVLFADEPTGSLDRKTGDGIMDLLGSLPETGLSVVMVTHEADYACRAQRTVELAGGRLAGIS
ncbi:ABC transporter ATP-binding protein [Desulfovibrio oxyclinae]|jgi:putative ABC transport system ATP-binding protein|uniref:ABC transporter ATP-binding protein n=1 Tax=Desulfovibrio oxyclinae TaxID=63560 RepID=UPI00038241C1|nr:ATP-binding cassette domain-containing protein [Desulfovibrio oxyclinae]